MSILILLKLLKFSACVNLYLLFPKMYFEKTISYQTPRLYCQIDITTQTYFHSPLYVGYQQYKHISYYNGFVRLT